MLTRRNQGVFTTTSVVTLHCGRESQLLLRTARADRFPEEEGTFKERLLSLLVPKYFSRPEGEKPREV
jgi:hypothetical protein